MSLLYHRYEALPRQELEQFQLERVQALVARLTRNVRRYREQLADVCVASLEDVAGLPMTTPEDVAAGFPYGMFALPLREVIRLHPTVGLGGTPIVTGYTRNDLAQWGRLVARQLVAGGATANDVVQVGLNGGVYRGTTGFLLGAETIEASVIAERPHHIDSQLAVLRSYRPTILVTSPDNAMEVMRALDRERIDPPSLQLRTVLLSRPVDRERREALESGLLVTVRCNFGIDEVLDPGFCVECPEGVFHVNEDQFLVESVNGELVVTTLGREAMPLLRYCTRVSCELRRDKCACGRTGVIVRPGPRLDGRLLVGETPVYENEIAEVLAQTRVAGHRFHLRVEERHVVISIEMTSDLFSDLIGSLMEFQRSIQGEFRTRLGLETEIRLVTPEVPPGT